MAEIAVLRAVIVSLVIVFAAGAAADEYSRGWGPAVGTPMPVLDAPDHAGVTRTLGNLTGDQGLLLFLNRSADW